MVVVDDDESVRESLPDLLGEFGFDARVFPSAEEFLISDSLGQTKCLVLDITMPRLDGIEAARQLRRSQRSAHLVFLTVHEDADFAQAAFDAGGLGYVVKALLASDLLPAIRAALADRRFVSPSLRLDEARLTFPDPE